MDWVIKLVDIKNKLTENGYSKTVDEITDAQMMLGTPGEMFLDVMNVLINLENQFITCK